MHCQIQTGGGFTTARNTEQDHLSLIQIAQRNAVIVGEGVINRRNARIIFIEIIRVKAMGTMSNRRWIQFHLLL
ncbi:Uncharacterised protein [Shigella flexneri]|nr:Uncharacterised protein [Shigella flexneri]